MSRVVNTLMTWLLILFTLLPWQIQAEQTTAKKFSQAEIEQLVAPIALYPDPLLAQILMACTYPIEIIAASKWLQENPNLKDDALKNALKNQTWDPSVKSLTAIPDILNKLSEKLEMTIKLGDAFLAQQDDVLYAIQQLRQKAQARGNLNSNNEQAVSVISNPNYQATSGDSQTTDPLQQEANYIQIEPTNPDVIAYPSYDPTTVYGEWPYSDYPADYYYPAGYGYVPGMALAYSLGYLLRDGAYGDISWTGQGITINVDRYFEFTGDRINNPDWKHDSTHRRGLPYRDANSQKKYAQAQIQSEQIREAFRGHQVLNNNNIDAVQQKISEQRSSLDQRFYGAQMPNTAQVPSTDKQIHAQDLNNLPQQRIDNQQRREQLEDNRGNRQQRIADRQDQGMSAQDRDIQAQRELFREQQQKQERIQEHQQEQFQVQQQELQQQRMERQQQRAEQQQQRIDQQRQQQQPRFQSQQFAQRQQGQQNAARERFAERQQGNAFDGINHAAQARQYSNRGSHSLASSRAASRPAASRGARGGGGRR
ncbi:DUF3300 domain-containing protein [Candidatus Berkiella aquae]|uniref:DUF3300 domain-containing protein n=1 Tax=Candidatus Berkiella aquae TaxID=295108 RepID=A0A0Q9Z257_9GAMM|nr:DUF3300 domain-containing protein [Candidatus Berkiella aquae]MCS5711987.1 DUF3300 domain-containing protein [Candidatus Berkiella aquae]